MAGPVALKGRVQDLRLTPLLHLWLYSCVLSSLSPQWVFFVRGVRVSGVLFFPPPPLVCRCLFVPSGREVLVVSTVTGQVMRSLVGHEDTVTGVALDNDVSQRLVTSSLDSTCKAAAYAPQTAPRCSPRPRPRKPLTGGSLSIAQCCCWIMCVAGGNGPAHAA